MAKWNPATKCPDLNTINGGEQLNAASPITADLMNAIVNTLLYLYYKRTTK